MKYTTCCNVLTGIDAAILAEELAEIYSNPTPKGWPELKKVNNWYLIDCVFFTIAKV